jgi:lysozyme
MAIPKECLDLIKGFEGYLRRLNDGTDRVKPYLCPAGVPTIGYGSTRYFPGGARVKMDDPPISEARAAECFGGELVENENDFDKLTSTKVHPIMRGVGVSFIYNCGNGAYRASNLRRVINERRWKDVPYELSKWKRGGGRVLAGLVRRRHDEGVLFMRGVRLMESGDMGQPTPNPVPIPTPISVPVPGQVPSQWWRPVWQWIFN